MTRSVVAFMASFALVVAFSTLSRSAEPSSASPADAEVSAVADRGDPRQRIVVIYEDIKKITVAAEDQDAITAAFDTTLDALFDYTAFARRTLKKSWPTLSPSQRKLFMEKFKQLIIQVYAKRFKPKTTFDVGYRGDTRFKKARARVLTTVTAKRISADVDYLFSFSEQGWYAYDLVIDSVSMALNWRKQFERTIANEGFDALIAKIDKRVGATNK